jgi:hypothetical protein
MTMIGAPCFAASFWIRISSFDILPITSLASVAVNSRGAFKTLSW